MVAALGNATDRTAATVLLMRALLAEDRQHKPDGIGRGYSFYPMQERRRRTLQFHEARLQEHPDEFEEWFTLTPSEFNELFQWVQPELARRARAALRIAPGAFAINILLIETDVAIVVMVADVVESRI